MREREDFFVVASILRLSTKYLMVNLRRKAIEALAEIWANTLKGHDAMVLRAISQEDALYSYPYVHPLHVLNLARETDVRVVVPSALYFLSLYPLDDVLRADHPKLTAPVQCGVPKPSTELSYHDLKGYSLIYQMRVDFMLELSRSLARRKPVCQNTASSCRTAYARLSSRVSRSWVTRTGPIHWMSQTTRWAEVQDIGLCTHCQADYRSYVESTRLELWNRLPLLLNLPSWSDLVNFDLPGSA